MNIKLVYMTIFFYRILLNAFRLKLIPKLTDIVSECYLLYFIVIRIKYMAKVYGTRTPDCVDSAAAMSTLNRADARYK